MTDYTDSSESSSSSDDEYGSTASEDTETGGPASGTSTDSDSESDTTLVDSGYGNSSHVEESGDGVGETTSESETGSSDSEPGPSDSDEHHIEGFANQILDNIASEQDIYHAPTISMDEYRSQFGYGKLGKYSLSFYSFMSYRILILTFYLENWEPGSWGSFWIQAEVSFMRMPRIYRRQFEKFEEDILEIMARRLELNWMIDLDHPYGHGEYSHVYEQPAE